MPTPTTRTLVRAALLAAGLALLPRGAAAQAVPAAGVTTPKAFFGFNVGDDYCLANYRQMSEYFSQLEKDSDRIKVIDIGATEENRRHLAAVVTSPANLRNLDRYREIARRLAQADGVGEAEARKLAAEGKAVVWIDAGIHATETLCPQALIETAYQLVNGRDAETTRILDDVICLFVHANPDGHDLVADWYMREKDPAKRSFAGLPRLYQKYTGHDLNRDFYANTQAETKNLNRLMYREWFPQVMCNHHQTGPAGTVLFCAPFRDPFNYFCDPLVINGVDAVGAAVISRFLSEGKPGATIRSGASYSTWFNGGLRTTAYFHNMIGLLTETIGSPTPTRIPLVNDKQLPKGDYLAPIAPQAWHFRQSVDYSVTCDKAILDYAARNREPLLFNIWRMGQNAIERGSRDSWTTTPKVVEAAKADAAARRGNGPAGAGARRGGAGGGGGGGGGGAGGGRGGDGGVAEFERLFHDKARRDARGYVIPSDQPDFPTAVKFVNALLGTGVRVHRAADDFTVAGKSYPKGSFVVKSAQAFRAHVLDMFEPQDHPNDFAYPGAPPTRPYDSAGYTLAFQMAVKFDRILDGFDGPFEEIKDASLPPRPARVAAADGAVGYFLDARANDAFRAVNRLRKAGEEILRLQKPAEIGGETVAAGTFYVPRKETTPAAVEAVAVEVGTPFRGTAVAPGAEAVPLKEARIALWDRYGGSMPSGWTRWILERFEFPFKVVYAPELDAGGLRDKYDVILLVDGAYTARAGGGERAEGGDATPPDRPAGAGEGPTEQRGRITKETTVPQFKAFLDAGGTILTVGSSTALARELGLPLEDHLVEADAEGKVKPLPSDKYYVPSSVLRLKVDQADPLAWGLGDDVDVMFSTSPTFKLAEGASEKGLRPVGWFDTKTPLRSGWAWGQEHLDGGVAMIDARVGKGRLALFGPQVLFRGQSHGTFKFIFNGIAQSVVEP